MRLWRDYFPRSTIVGIDSQEKISQLGSRVRLFTGKQQDEEFIRRVLNDLGVVPDIVIDDGSHVGSDQWATFAQLFPNMPAGSIYVIEDMHTSYFTAYEGGFPAPHTSSIALAGAVLDQIQAADKTFIERPDLGSGPPTWDFGPCVSMHVYPGIVFIEK